MESASTLKNTVSIKMPSDDQNNLQQKSDQEQQEGRPLSHDLEAQNPYSIP